MAPRIIDNDSRQPMDESVAKFKEYVSLKRQIDDLEARQKQLKPDLMEFVEANGIEDDKGHIIFTLDDEIDGYRSMQRQRRVSFGYDEEASRKILQAKGLWEECTTQVRVLNEDAVMAALYDGRLSEADVDAIRPQKVTWAFVPLKK